MSEARMIKVTTRSSVKLPSSMAVQTSVQPAPVAMKRTMMLTSQANPMPTATYQSDVQHSCGSGPDTHRIGGRNEVEQARAEEASHGEGERTRGEAHQAGMSQKMQEP